MSKKIRKAIIPAAGLGTRFLPATKAQPKEMLPIVDKPTIQYIIEEAVASGRLPGTAQCRNWSARSRRTQATAARPGRPAYPFPVRRTEALRRR